MFLAKTLRFALAATLLAAANSFAAGTADAQITISVFKVLDASGADVALNPLAWAKPYSSTLISQVVHGEDYQNYQGGANRNTIASVCSNGGSFAGLDLATAACTGGIPGTTRSAVDTAVPDSSASARSLQFFSFMLPSGYSFEISGTAQARVTSSGVPEAGAGTQHVSRADAGIVIGPQLFELRGFSASVNEASNAAHSFAEAIQSTPFSYRTTNTYDDAISVLLSWSSSASVGNAAVLAAVPEASSVVLMLLGLAVIGFVARRRGASAMAASFGN